MTPETRKTLVRQWQRFSKAVEETFGTDDAASGVTVGDVIMDEPVLRRVNRTRATYLAGLVEAGLLKPADPIPDDHDLWEMHPINIETSADLYP